MAITTYSNSPYNDDFATSDKNYVRILFRPGRSVQVRELNQLQSNLQDQIDKFGRHVFKDGDRVLDGYTTYEPNIQSIPVAFVGNATATQAQLNSLKGKNINKDGTDIKARILGAQAFVGANSVKYYRLYIKYSGSNGSASATFAAGDSLLLSTGEASVTLGTNTTVSAGAALATVQTVAASLEAPGYYGGFFQDEGVFFVKGCFVHTDAQEAFAYKATSTTTITGAAVFDIEETTVDYTSDASLLDNASGSPNENAPGADRYKVSLNLKFVPSSSTTVVENQQRVKLLDITGDNIKTPVRTQYSELAKALAQRTEEESGSYTVKPFKIDVREYLNDEAGNRGKYTDDEIYNSGGDPLISGVSNLGQAQTEGAKRLVVGIEPSVAYVNGYRVELLDKQENVMLKGRESSDIASEIGHQLQTTRPTTYIEGTFDENSDGLEIAEILAMDFSPDHKYYLYASGAAAQVQRGYCRIHSVVQTGTMVHSQGTPMDVDATHRIYIYDINMGSASNATNSVNEMKALKLIPDDSSNMANGNIRLENGSGFTLFGDSSDRPATAIYDLPYEAINSVDGNTIKYSVEKTFQFAGSDIVDNNITITTGDGIFTSTNPNDYSCLIEGYAASVANTGLIYVETVEILSGGTSVKIGIVEGDGTSISLTNQGEVRAPVQITGGVRTKTQTTGQADTITTTMTKGQVFELTKADAYAIESITHSTNPDGAAVDIKSDFLLDDGQRSTHYNLSSVQYRGNKTLPSGTLTVTYSYYLHGAGSVFTRNSYTTDGTTQIALENIPKYAGRRLSNSLDFRPVVGTPNYEGSHIRANQLVTVDFDYYMPRIDLVSLNQLADVTITTGKASSNPIPPTLPKDSILLYTIYKPGYVYNLNDLDITHQDQRRYTMEDIGDLNERVKNLEYYATLSSLEREAEGKSLQDTSGERFKNGIFTDSFSGHGAGDTTLSAYRVAVDNEDPACRPMYLSENSRWSYVQGLSATGTVSTWNGESVPSTTIRYSGKRKNAVTLDFIEKTLESQPYATHHISVNPYDVATWTGTLEVSPSSDEWKDVTHAPDIVINEEGNNDAILNQVAANPNLLGTEWNEWTTNWVGRRRRTRWWGRRRWTRVRDRFWSRDSRDSRLRHLKERQTRSGIVTSLVENFERETIDEKVLNTTFIPFIRSRKIFFRARLLKPNTQFYVYFDDVNITSYATDNSGFVQWGGDEGSAVGSTDLTNSVKRFDGQTSISGADGSIVTDASGDVTGWIVIPNNDLLRFRTGTRQIRLTDRSDNNKILETSAAETSYFAQGLLETRQRTVLSTRQLSIERTRVTDSRNQIIRTVRRDPVAQTFMIGNEPTGIFLSSVDVYFQDHDPNIPIELSIVTVENGIPTQNTVPFSKVIKKWGDSGVTEDTTRAQNATKFMFDVPVYLQPGIEYAIVLISNSARWRVWTAKVGGTNKVAAGANAEVVTKNPNLGVFLKSQNASTWTPDQNRDLKFVLNRADFDTTAKTATFTGKCPARGELSYIDVTTAGQGYLTGAPTVTISGGGGSGATAKAYVGNGGVIDSIEVINPGSGYTSAPTISIGTPERITISTSAISTSNDGVISLVNYAATVDEDSVLANGTLPNEETNVIRIKNGQKFTYHSNGGTAIGGLSDGATYYAKVTARANTDILQNTDFAYNFQVYSDANLTTVVPITGTGNDAQYIIPVSNDTPAATAVLDTWRGSTFLNIIEDLELPESNIDYVMTVRGNDASTGSVDETLAYNVFPNETLYTGTRVSHDSSSGHNAASYLDILKLDATLSTTDSKIGPIIDLDRLSLISFDNIINNTKELETIDNEGESAARYISRRFRLENYSDKVNLYLDGYRPNECTNIRVYVKERRNDLRNLSIGRSRGLGIGTNGDNWDQIPWQEMQLAQGKFLPVSTDYDFTEVEYTHTTLSEFNEIAVKIVFLSSDKAYAPEIKNLRVIATV